MKDKERGTKGKEQGGEWESGRVGEWETPPHPLSLSPHRGKVGWWCIGVLILIALALRIGYVLQGVEVPPLDTPDYDEIARNLLSGNGFLTRGMRSWRPPLYPVLLAGIYGVFGYSHLAVKLVQSVVGALLVPLVYGIGWEVEGRRVGKVAALIVALYGPLVASVNEVMTETVFAVFVAGTVLLVLKGMRSDGIGYEAVGGIVLGLAVLTRPILLGFPLALVIWGVLLRHSEIAVEGRSSKRIWKALVVGGCMVLTVLPWTARNYVVHGALVPVSTMGGFVFGRSNSLHPDWRKERGWGWTDAFAERISSEIERDRYWWKKGRTFIWAHPGLYLRWVGERFLHFWYFFHPRYNFWFGLVAPFFVAGAVMARTRRAFWLLYAVILFCLGLFTFVFYGCARFRLPMEPLFIVFVAYALCVWWERCEARRKLIMAVGVWIGVQGACYMMSESLRGGMLILLRGLGMK